MKKFASVMLLTALSMLGQESGVNKTVKVAISTQTPTVQADTPLQVNVTLTNISDTEVNVSDAISNMTGQCNNYVLDVRDAKGDTVKKRTFKHEELASWKTILRSLKPQESVTDQIMLDRQYLLSPGQYSIRVIRVIPNESGGGYAASNSLTVEVTAQDN